MIAVVLKGLAGRKVRALLTAFAVVIGVSMVSGTFILTDTMQKSFDGLFAESSAKTDAVIRGKEVVKGSFSGNGATIPESVLADVRALPEVEAAGGDVSPQETNSADIIGTDGKAVAKQSSGGSYDPANARFSPLKLKTGAWPKGPKQVVIDAGTARKQHYKLGDSVTIATNGKQNDYELTGIASFGDVDSLGFASIAVWDVKTAQTLLDREGRFDSVSIAAKSGTSATELVEAVRPIVPKGLEVKDSAAQAKADSQELDEGMATFRYVLLGFGGIALLVGAFVIFNTLSITVAQRTREFATLRTLGASRKQVMRSVVLEGLVIGLVASLIGLGLGFGISKGMIGSVQRAWRRPAGRLDGDPDAHRRGLAPARYEHHAPGEHPARAAGDPGAADRGGAGGLDPSPDADGRALAQRRPRRGAGLDRRDLGRHLPRRGEPALVGVLLGGGVLGLFAGIALTAPRLVKPLARVVGWPAKRAGGVAGELAGANAVRNPGRTASTAAALMIGLTLVTVVAVLGSGFSATTRSAVSEQVRADHVIDGKQGLGFRTSEGDALAKVPGVTKASHVRSDTALVQGDEGAISGIDPATIASFYRFTWSEGSDRTLGQLGADGAIVTKDYASDEQLKVGAKLSLTTPAGEERTLVVRGIYDPPQANQLLGPVSMSQEGFDAAFKQPKNGYTFLDADASASAAIKSEAKSLGDATYHAGADFPKDATKDMATMLAMLYVLLGFSIIVSLFGMVNTMVLSVFERTREIGMLRAIGMTRRQARRMIRHESIITALIGAALGLGVGLFLAAMITQAMDDLAFAVPVATLVAFTLVAVLAGIGAAILPARRASRLNVLDALHYE